MKTFKLQQPRWRSWGGWSSAEDGGPAGTSLGKGPHWAGDQNSSFRGRGSGSRAGTLMHSGSLKPFSMDQTHPQCAGSWAGGAQSALGVSRGRAAALELRFCCTRPRGRTLCGHGRVSVVAIGGSCCGAGTRGSLRTLPSQPIAGLCAKPWTRGDPGTTSRGAGAALGDSSRAQSCVPSGWAVQLPLIPILSTTMGKANRQRSSRSGC